MNTRQTLLSAGLAATAVFLSVRPVPVRAQTPAASASPAAAPQDFTFDFGTSAANPAGYFVKATEPVSSVLKGQRIRFTSVKTTGAGATTTTYFTIQTGKYRTVAQLAKYVHESFTKFLAGPPPNTEVGTVGDIRYGGVVHFVVESKDVLRYVTQTPGQPDGLISLTRDDVAAFDAILTSGLSAKQ